MLIVGSIPRYQLKRNGKSFLPNFITRAKSKRIERFKPIFFSHQTQNFETESLIPNVTIGFSTLKLRSENRYLLGEISSLPVLSKVLERVARLLTILQPITCSLLTRVEVRNVIRRKRWGFFSLVTCTKLSMKKGDHRPDVGFRQGI